MCFTEKGTRVEISAAGLGIDDVVRIAVDRIPLTLSAQSLVAIGAGASRANEVAQQRPIYGRSTGVGANRSVPVHDPDRQLERLLRSHSTSLGEPRDAVRVRAMVAVRIAQLALGGSGISVTAVGGLVAGLNCDSLPEVREGGSLGTGDVTALAVIGTWLLDHPEGARVLPGDGLALISSNAGVLGDAALAVTGLRRLARAAVRVASLSLRAVHGNVEAFGTAVERATPFPGAQRVCQGMRRELQDDRYSDAPARIQDPFGLRAMPQGHGVFLDALDRATEVVEAMINAPSENPVFDQENGVTHHGAFHAAYLTHAIEALLLALVQAAQLSMGRITMLASPELTGAPPFLADGTPGASGTMAMEFVAASALARIRSLAMPVGGNTVTVSLGLEEDASFASLSARNALEAIYAYQDVLACELVSAARALAINERLPRWPELEPMLAGLGDIADRDLTPDLQLATDVVPSLAGRFSAHRQPSPRLDG